MAVSSHRTRWAQWNSYFEFCILHGLSPLPANSHQICRYIVYLARTMTYSSINNYLSGIILLHKMYGYDSSFRSDFIVIFTLQGLKRVLGATSVQKSPLLPEDLSRMSCMVNMINDFEFAVWACIVLSFRTLLRKSNLLPSDGSTHCIRRRDLSFTSWGLNITVGSTKTIQFRERVLQIPVVAAPSSSLCAVRLLKEHLYRTRSVSKDDYVFMVPSGDRLTPLSYTQALRKLKEWGSVVAPSKDIGFHSLRRGAATHMSMLGIKLEDIKAAGDWASLAVLIYLSTPLSHKIEIDKLIANSLR